MIGAHLQQCASGAFPSEVAGLSDENCFVTATVSLLLDPHRHDAALARALDFIESCESPSMPGAFAFYPAHGAALRRVDGLPPDADDTSLAWLALLHGKRRTENLARAAFEQVIGPASHRLVAGSMPGWVRPYAVRTWLADCMPDNPVDLAVNANVAALGHRLRMSAHPACEGAVASILAAARGAYPPGAFARRLTPYYADISELWFCVRRAIDCGAERLSAALPWLQPVISGDAYRTEKPLYCNDHGMPIWRSPVLQDARRRLDANYSRFQPSRERSTQ